MTVLSMKQRIELKKKLNNRSRVFGGWVSYRDPGIAETFAKAGLDFIAIDMEHTTISKDDANRIITSVQSEGTCCLPRPVSHNNDYIKPILEAGADGLIIPVVNDGFEAADLVSKQKFPPIGKRSYGVNRAHGYGHDFNEYISSWNSSGVFIAQVETIGGVENIDAIANTDGVDAVMIGPYDIAGSLGVPGETNHPNVRNAAKKVIEACKNANIGCMTQISAVNRATIRDVFDQGFTAVVLASDLFILWEWADQTNALIEEMR